jgi:hypothetical protein
VGSLEERADRILADSGWFESRQPHVFLLGTARDLDEFAFGRRRELTRRRCEQFAVRESAA